MNKDVFDIGAEIAPPDSLQRLRTMVEDLRAGEKMAEEMEIALKEIQKANNQIKTADLPDLMAECGMAELTTEDGLFRVTIENFVAGSLPKDPMARDAAIDWLEENNAGTLIKTTLRLVFDKSEHNEALSLAAELHERGYDSAAESGVHPQTLIAHIRERLANGEEVPLEKLGLFAGRRAKIKAVPAKKLIKKGK